MKTTDNFKRYASCCYTCKHVRVLNLGGYGRFYYCDSDGTCPRKTQEEWDYKEAKKIISYGAKIFFSLVGIVMLLSIARVFTPTTAEFAMIKVLPAVCSSEFVSETIPKDAKTLYTLGIKAFEDKLKKLVPQEPKKENQ